MIKVFEQRLCIYPKIIARIADLKVTNEYAEK